MECLFDGKNGKYDRLGLGVLYGGIRNTFLKKVMRTILSIVSHEKNLTKLKKRY